MTRKENYLELVLKSCHGKLKGKGAGVPEQVFKEPRYGDGAGSRGSPAWCLSINLFFSVARSRESEGEMDKLGQAALMSLGFCCLVFFPVLMTQVWRES